MMNTRGQLERLARLRLAPGYSARAQQRQHRHHGRLHLVATAFGLAFLTIGLRLVAVGLPQEQSVRPVPPSAVLRGRLLDRHGMVLAASVPSVSLQIDRALLRAPDQLPAELALILKPKALALADKRLAGTRRHLLLARHLDPQQQRKITELGRKGLFLVPDTRRVYPQDALAAHVVGFSDPHGRGLAASERAGDAALAAGSDVTLSLDLRVQFALEEGLALALQRTQAQGAAGLIMDARNGEILALASLPSFSPAKPNAVASAQRFNKVTQAVYELGSVFKVFTAAAALEYGGIEVTDRFNVHGPLYVDHHQVRDLHPSRKVMALPQILANSSNVGSVRLALASGWQTLHSFLSTLGFATPSPVVGHQRSARPLFPKVSSALTTATLSYGHGLAVTPLQYARAFAAMVNGGKLVTPRLIPITEAVNAPSVISPQTSAQIRDLLRLVVLRGTAKGAQIPGLRIGGKTGTADKAVAGGYDPERNISSFAAAFPIAQPRYVFFAVLDEPNAADEGAFASRAIVPSARDIISRVASVLGIIPDDSKAEAAADSRLLSLYAELEADDRPEAPFSLIVNRRQRAVGSPPPLPPSPQYQAAHGDPVPLAARPLSSALWHETQMAARLR